MDIHPIPRASSLGWRQPTLPCRPHTRLCNQPSLDPCTMPNYVARRHVRKRNVGNPGGVFKTRRSKVKPVPHQGRTYTMKVGCDTARSRCVNTQPSKGRECIMRNAITSQCLHSHMQTKPNIPQTSCAFKGPRNALAHTPQRSHVGATFANLMPMLGT